MPAAAWAAAPRARGPRGPRREPASEESDEPCIASGLGTFLRPFRRTTRHGRRRLGGRDVWQQRAHAREGVGMSASTGPLQLVIGGDADVQQPYAMQALVVRSHQQISRRIGIETL